MRVMPHPMERRGAPSQARPRRMNPCPHIIDLRRPSWRHRSQTECPGSRGRRRLPGMCGEQGFLYPNTGISSIQAAVRLLAARGRWRFTHCTRGRYAPDIVPCPAPLTGLGRARSWLSLLSRYSAQPTSATSHDGIHLMNARRVAGPKTPQRDSTGRAHDESRRRLAHCSRFRRTN